MTEIPIELQACDCGANRCWFWFLDAGQDLFGLRHARVTCGPIGGDGRTIRYDFAEERVMSRFVRACVLRRSCASRLSCAAGNAICGRSARRTWNERTRSINRPGVQRRSVNVTPAGVSLSVSQTFTPIHSAGTVSTTPAKSLPEKRGSAVCVTGPPTFLTSLRLIEAAMTRTNAVPFSAQPLRQPPPLLQEPRDRRTLRTVSHA